VFKPQPQLPEIKTRVQAKHARGNLEPSWSHNNSRAQRARPPIRTSQSRLRSQGAAVGRLPPDSEGPADSNQGPGRSDNRLNAMNLLQRNFFRFGPFLVRKKCLVSLHMFKNDTRRMQQASWTSVFHRYPTRLCLGGHSVGSTATTHASTVPLCVVKVIEIERSVRQVANASPLTGPGLQCSSLFRPRVFEPLVENRQKPDEHLKSKGRAKILLRLGFGS
jgi:hypothetical protein